MWTGGSWDEDLGALVEVAGAGAFVLAVLWVFGGRDSGHAQDLDQQDEDASGVFAAVRGPLQSVHRADYWGVTENMHVSNSVSQLLAGASDSPLRGSAGLYFPCVSVKGLGVRSV